MAGSKLRIPYRPSNQQEWAIPKKGKQNRKARGLVIERRTGNSCSAKESISDRLVGAWLYRKVSAASRMAKMLQITNLVRWPLYQISPRNLGTKCD